MDSLFSQFGFNDVKIHSLDDSSGNEAVQAMEWNAKVRYLHVHPNSMEQSSYLTADDHSQAVQAAKIGDNKTAEKWHRKALNAKINAKLEWTTIAISHNGLGEALLELGRLKEAEEHLKKALAMRTGKGAGHVFDAAVSRENLAQVYQAMEKPDMARTTRTDGENKKELCCSNETVRL